MLSAASRSLLRSPLERKESAEAKRRKRGNLVEDAVGAGMAEEVGMEAEGSARGGVGEGEKVKLIDVSAIQETVMTRVNESMLMFSKEGESTDPAVMQIVSVISTAVSVAVSEIMKGFRDFEQRITDTLRSPPPTAVTMKLKACVTRLAYENDRLQQYTRRESCRITGLKEEKNETASQVEVRAIKVFADAGVEVKEEEIQAVHRVGRSRGDSRPVLVKFVSRKKRREVMLKKKALRGKEGYDGVFISDDLTPLRAKLLGLVKHLPMIDRAWTIDGRILCTKKLPVGHPQAGNQKPLSVESPDDIFDVLGVELSGDDFRRLGLGYLADDEFE